MTARGTFSIVDASGEYSAFGLPGVDLTGANFDAQDGLWDTFQTNIDAIIIGNIAFRKLLAQDLVINNNIPVNQFAQRELKWLVRYTDNVTGEKHSVEIATPDLTLLLSGTDNMNIGVGAGQAFVAAFQGVVRPSGNACTVNSIVVVGRNI